MALGFPLGLNGLAATLSLDIEDLEDWCDAAGLVFAGDGDRGLKVGSLAHGFAAEVVVDSTVFETVAVFSVSLGFVSTSETIDRAFLMFEAGSAVSGALTEPFATLSDVVL